MNEFLIAIRIDLVSENPSPSPRQTKETVKPWQDWIAHLAAQDKLIAPSKRWDVDGWVSVLQRCHGPGIEETASVHGLLLIRAKNYDEAVEIAIAFPTSRNGAILEERMAILSA